VTPTSTPATPSQTAGPFLSIGTSWGALGAAVEAGVPGSFVLSGTVTDGAGAPVTDALVEFWQADPSGRFPPETPDTWRGFTRALTDEGGTYRMRTLRPGRVACQAGLQAPHIDVSIFARGLLQRLVTRVYLGDEQEANASDPVLASIADEADRARLVAVSVPGGFRFDIALQGPKETPFFVP